MRDHFMAAEKFLVVVYDISNDKRRTRVHKILKDYGTPVQYSVFECLIDDANMKKMILRVKKVLRPRLDHLRLYSVCGNCREKIEVIGIHEISQKKISYVV
jgi:CRISPR-associated protein Cas2